MNPQNPLVTMLLSLLNRYNGRAKVLIILAIGALFAMQQPNIHAQVMAFATHYNLKEWFAVGAFIAGLLINSHVAPKPVPLAGGQNENTPQKPLDPPVATR